MARFPRLLRHVFLSHLPTLTLVVHTLLSLSRAVALHTGIYIQVYADTGRIMVYSGANNNCKVSEKHIIMYFRTSVVLVSATMLSTETKILWILHCSPYNLKQCTKAITKRCHCLVFLFTVENNFIYACNPSIWDQSLFMFMFQFGVYLFTQQATEHQWWYTRVSTVTRSSRSQSSSHRSERSMSAWGKSGINSPAASSYPTRSKPPSYPFTTSDYGSTVKSLYNGHIGPCKTGPYNEVASLLR